MKFLIAGLGSIGRRHLRNLLTLGENDITLFRTYQGAIPDDELSDYQTVTDLQVGLDRHPDAIIIANPTSLHLDVAIPAAQAGCHILLEKPVSHSMDGVQALRNAVHASGVQVLVGYQFRFHPGLEQIKALLERGAIGRPLSARAQWGEYLPGWHAWEDYRRGYSARAELGGGVTLTLSHPLDYLRWLFGEVEAIWAFTDHLSDLEIDVEDTAEIGIRFNNGILASLHLDYNQCPPAHRLEIIGTNGTLCWDNADGVVHEWQSTVNSWQAYPAPPGFERNHLFEREMRHFLAVVRGEVEPVCGLEDGVRALELALASLASQKQGRLIKLGYKNS